MRFSIVARSLGVILASPLLALPPGFAAESEPPPHASNAQRSLAMDAARVRAARLVRPLLAGQGAPSDPAATPPPASRPPQEFEVMVSCAADGCVVSTGLDVVVVASPPRR